MDDTEQFELDKRRWAAEMQQDKELRAAALELLVRSDRHHHSYQWTWLGLPIIQFPEDVIVTQEIVWQARPTVIVETGVARGGSMIFLASLLELIGEGKVVGVDIDIRPHNRTKIEFHPLKPRVHLIQGSSTAPETVDAVRSHIDDKDRVMVLLDSNHTHAHVLEELNLYAPLVTAGQYLVVSDTVVENIPRQSHRPRAWGPGNNPRTALEAYLRSVDRFEVDPYINAKLLQTGSPGAYLRCIK